MSRKQISDSPEMDDDEDMLENPYADKEDREDAADKDPDFDYNEPENKGQQERNKQKGEKDLKTQLIKDQQFDEAVELSDGGSEIESDNGQQYEDEEKPRDDSTDEPPAKPTQKAQAQPVPVQQKPTAQPKLQAQKPLVAEKKTDSEDDEDKDSKVVGAYNPADYANLKVTSEIQELFRYITRYKPVNVELETKLKAFIPDYIPAVGEVDAFLKPSRPDGQPETLGLLSIDEPCLNQSKKSKLDLQIKEFMKIKKAATSAVVHSIENADKNPREILAWINDVNEVHKKKQPPSVVYTKPFPEIETLMQEWPLEIEDALQNLKIPTEEIDMDLGQYCKLACALLDIPVHNTTNNKNLVESLHVFFTLYSEFRANPHFQQKNDQYENFAPGSTNDFSKPMY